MAEENSTITEAPRQEPTEKQIKAMELMVENGGNASAAMREAGYSPAMAKNPQKLTRSQAFKEHFEKKYTPEYMEKLISEMAETPEFAYFVFPKTMDDIEIEFRVNAVGISVVNISAGEKGKYAWYKKMDVNARKFAIEQVNKIQGNFAPEKSITITIDADASDEIKDLTKQLNDLHRGTGSSSNGGATGSVDAEVQDKE